MSLRTLLERDVVACAPSTTIKEVAALMKAENVGAVLITEADKPVGIVTDRDLVLRCLAEGSDCTGTVDEIMTTDVETVLIDDGIFDVVQVMRKNEIRRVPVVDERGCAVGLLSFGDVYHLVTQELHDLLSTTAPERDKLVEKKAA